MLNQTYSSFEQVFKEVFDHPVMGKETGVKLPAIKKKKKKKKGKQPAAKFAPMFHTSAAWSRWNEPALKNMFRQGLIDMLQMYLACSDYSMLLKQFIQLPICTDNLLRIRKPRPTSVAVFMLSFL